MTKLIMCNGMVQAVQKEAFMEVGRLFREAWGFGDDMFQHHKYILDVTPRIIWTSTDGDRIAKRCRMYGWLPSARGALVYMQNSIIRPVERWATTVVDDTLHFTFISFGDAVYITMGKTQANFVVCVLLTHSDISRFKIQFDRLKSFVFDQLDLRKVL